jgi:hypothetical protein
MELRLIPRIHGGSPWSPQEEDAHPGAGKAYPAAVEAHLGVMVNICVLCKIFWSKLGKIKKLVIRTSVSAKRSNLSVFSLLLCLDNHRPLSIQNFYLLLYLKHL